MSKWIIKAKVDNFTAERIAMEVETEKEAKKRLEQAFGKPVDGFYIDRFGQRFWIEEAIEE